MGHDESSGMKHERRRIGEYPHFHLVHVCCPSLPPRLTTCACNSLSLSYMATRTAMNFCRFLETYLEELEQCRLYIPHRPRTRSQTQLRLL